jgi:RNA polymerase sigma-70 factor (ECF subfamily)
MNTSQAEITQLLLEWSGGDKAALDKLMPLVYDELRRIAGYYLNRQRPGHTLQATALVNEAFIRLIDVKDARWQHRAHFFAVAAKIMRNILIDHARSHQRAKRGGGRVAISLNEVAVIVEDQASELIALDDALNRLSVIDSRKSEIVELRFFGGLSIDEAAEVLKISSPTVQREWRMAKAWLHRELSNQDRQ